MLYHFCIAEGHRAPQSLQEYPGHARAHTPAHTSLPGSCPVILGTEEECHRVENKIWLKLALGKMLNKKMFILGQVLVASITPQESLGDITQHDALFQAWPSGTLLFPYFPFLKL